MNCSGDRFASINTTRREFLKTTSTLAGSAALVSLDPGSAARAAEAQQAPATATGLAGPDVVTIRGHHLFDMLDALGTGKSAHKTLGPVAQRIRAQPKVPIKLVIGVDDICNPCASWDHEKARCTKSLDKYPQDNENSLTSDTNAIRVLGLKPGDVVRADELYRRIKAKITKKVFAEQVCVACRLVDKCKETYEAKIAAAVAALSSKASEIRL
ncbi:MAG: DUF1284 domain-containing protein [Thermoguttaceae bacterium]|jgi:hypothetical protein